MTKAASLLRIIAIFFLIAPFGNLLTSLLTSGVSDWYLPSVLFALLAQISAFDWLWLVLVFSSGLLLLIRHKTAWLAAVITLLLVVTLNMSSLMDSDQTNVLSGAQEVQVLFSLFLSACVLLVLFYARYPYLDRRQGWLRSAARRFDVKTPARLWSQKAYECETESLSESGCRLRMHEKWDGNNQLRFVDLEFPEFGRIRIKAQIVGQDDRVLRLKFREILEGDRAEFSRWIGSKGGPSGP